MSRQHHRKQRFKLRSFYIWHRYMGISAALFALLIAATGLLLNHTEDFKLDSRYVNSDWVLDWYGIRAPEKLLSFAAAGQHVTLMGEHLYLNRKEVDGEFRDLVGAVRVHDMFVVAVSDAILLLTPRGDIVERLGEEDGVPAGIRRIGIDEKQRLIAETSLDYYQADADFIKWQRWQQAPQSVQWARSGALDPRLVLSLQQHYRGEVLPMERVVLDLHSGRFFGKAGPWVFDIAALLLMLLSLTGTWIWLKRRR
jgi:hypothetical protein